MNSSSEKKIRSELFTTRFGRNSVLTFLPVAQVDVSKSVAQVEVSKSVAQKEAINNVSQAEITPNISEVIRSTVSKVDRQIELEVKNLKQRNLNFNNMAEWLEMSAQQLQDLITGIRQNQQIHPSQNKLTLPNR